MNNPLGLQRLRRDSLKFLAVNGAALLSGACSRSNLVTAGNPTDADRVLTAGPASVRLVPGDHPQTAVWAYGGTVPGETLSAKQGESLSVDFRNKLPDPSTVHWHGIRNLNAMDGVPFLTQPPVEPGQSFRYELTLPDAGTYWYHPHLGTPEQVGRGLYGALIVHEPDPPPVDRELVWILDDWRLDKNARIVDDFYKWSDVAFAGRVGNSVTVNGKVFYTEPVVAGERVRLRLINTANARLVSLSFGGHPVWIIAVDGNPLLRPMRVQANQNVFLGPGQRADVIVDMTGEAGAAVPVVDRFRPDRAYAVAHFQYAKQSASTVVAHRGERPAPEPLASNNIAEPEKTDQMQVKIVMDGGMMRGPSIPWTERAALRLRQWTGSREAYPSWSMNGKAHMSHSKDHGFEFTAERGRTVHITYVNRSSHWHPMHLHGHVFRELTRNGRPVPMTPWRDTTMVAPRETLEIAFVADNPGDWLIHCHILEHHAGGMGVQFRVTA